jgi:predicted HicB family RNase H-like nuclease
MSKPTYSFHVAWSDEDEAFVATCPEFEGLSGFGTTQASALKESQIALKLMIETYQAKGWKLPEPLKLPEFSGQWRQRIGKRTHARLVREAEAEGLSLNTYVASLVENRSGIIEAQKESIRQLRELIYQIATAKTGANQPVLNAAAGPVCMPGSNLWRSN